MHVPRNESPCFFGANTEQDCCTRSENENNYQSPIVHIIDWGYQATAMALAQTQEGALHAP